MHSSFTCPQVCSAVNGKSLKCKTPGVKAPPDVDLLGNRTIRHPDNVTVTWDIYIGFILDGIMEYRNLTDSTDKNLREKGLIRILPTPTFPSSHKRKKKLWYKKGSELWLTVCEL